MARGLANVSTASHRWGCRWTYAAHTARLLVRTGSAGKLVQRTRIAALHRRLAVERTGQEVHQRLGIQ